MIHTFRSEYHVFTSATKKKYCEQDSVISLVIELTLNRIRKQLYQQSLLRITTCAHQILCQSTPQNLKKKKTASLHLTQERAIDNLVDVHGISLNMNLTDFVCFQTRECSSLRSLKRVHKPHFRRRPCPKREKKKETCGSSICLSSRCCGYPYLRLLTPPQLSCAPTLRLGERSPL